MLISIILNITIDEIGNRKIGKNLQPLIIVELGINHSGNYNLAKKLIDTAKKAGAEIIKNQTHIADKEMSDEAKKIIPVHKDKNIFEIIKDNSISEKDEIKMMKYVKKKKMIFISTPFSREAAIRLNKLGVPAFKIGSGECNNYPLIELIAKFKKPIILSTGMNDIKSIKKSVKIIEKYKTPYALLHTTNLYPTPYKLIRLNAIDELKRNFLKRLLVYQIIHQIITAFAALGKGVSIIEKHYTDTYQRKGVDIDASIDF